MSYVFKIENLDCANCAAKVEAGVKKLEGIIDCNVNFFLLKMKIDAAGELTDDLLSKIRKAAKRIEPDIKFTLVG